MNQVKKKKIPKNRFAHLTSAKPRKLSAAYVYAPGNDSWDLNLL